MNRDKIETQTCYVHQHNFVGTLLYIACLCPNLVSVRFYTLQFKFPNFFIYLSLVSLTRAHHIHKTSGQVLLYCRPLALSCMIVGRGFLERGTSKQLPAEQTS